MVVAFMIPVFDQLAVSIEHDDVPGRKHILARIRQVVDRPHDVGGSQRKHDGDDRGEPDLLRPEPATELAKTPRPSTASGLLETHPSDPPPSALRSAAELQAQPWHATQAPNARSQAATQKPAS